MLTDDEINNIVVHPLPEFVKLTAVMDCCHSGTGLDLPFTHTAYRWKREPNPLFRPSDVQLFSGCEDATTSADAATGKYGLPGGAMTSAFCDVLRANPCRSYVDLMACLAGLMKERRFAQRPQLTSSQPFSFDRPFVLDVPLGNLNPTLGRVVTCRFPPQPRPIHAGDPLDQLLADLGLSPAMAALAAGTAGAFGGWLLGKVLG
jgi:hypothetical protein